MRKIEYKLPT